MVTLATICLITFTPNEDIFKLVGVSLVIIIFVVLRFMVLWIDCKLKEGLKEGKPHECVMGLVTLKGVAFIGAK